MTFHLSHHKQEEYPSHHDNKLVIDMSIMNEPIIMLLPFYFTSSDSTETFLTSCIPNLQLDTFAVELNGANLEVNANSGNEGWSERVVGKAKQQAAFPDT